MCFLWIIFENCLAFVFIKPCSQSIDLFLFPFNIECVFGIVMGKPICSISVCWQFSFKPDISENMYNLFNNTRTEFKSEAIHIVS